MTKQRKGLAALDIDTRKRIASIGGMFAHDIGKAHEYTSDEARTAGKKGGAAPRYFCPECYNRVDLLTGIEFGGHVRLRKNANGDYQCPKCQKQYAAHQFDYDGFQRAVEALVAPYIK